MTPLSGLTTAEVESELYNCVEEYHSADVSRLLAELLRREREWCAVVCEADIGEVETCSDTAVVAPWLRQAAARIRRLS